MVDFNESESAFLVVRSTRGVWFDNLQRFPPSFAKVPISFCFAPGEGAQVQTELGPTASVEAGITSLSPSLLGAEVRTRTPGSILSLRSLRTLAYSPSPRRAASRTRRSRTRPTQR